MGELLAILWPSHHEQLCEGIYRLFTDRVDCDFKLWLNDDSRSFQAHSFIFKIFCDALTSSLQASSVDSLQLRLEDEDFCRNDVRCILEFMYSGKTYVEAKRLDVVKKLAEKMGVAVFVEIIQGIKKTREPNPRQVIETARVESDSSKVIDTSRVEPNSDQDIVVPSVIESAQENVPVSCVEEHNYGTKIQVQDKVTVNREPVPLNSGTIIAFPEKSVNDPKSKQQSENIRKPVFIKPKNSETGTITAFPEKSVINLKAKTHCQNRRKQVFIKPKNSVTGTIIKSVNVPKPKKQKLINSKNENKPVLNKPKNAEAGPKQDLICPVCDKVYKNKNTYLVHVELHSANPDVILESCSFCSFKGLHLDTHMMIVHGRDYRGNLMEKSFKCDQCDFSCVVQFQLNRHKLVKHTEPSLKCDKCPAVFHQNGELNRHKKLTHPEKGRSFMCDICGSCYKNSQALNLHTRRHSSAKVTCDVCGIQIVAYCLNKHKKAMHADAHKRFKCTLCGAHCKQRMSLVLHFKGVHKIGKDEMKTMMKENVIEVSADDVPASAKKAKEKVPHICFICEKSFTQKSSLKKHMKKHGENTTVYKCTFCEYTAQEKHQLKCHIKRKHKTDEVDLKAMTNANETYLSTGFIEMSNESLELIDQSNLDSSSN